MTLLLLGLGLVFVVEGLVLALAPLRIEAVMQFLMTLSKDQRRTLGWRRWHWAPGWCFWRIALALERRPCLVTLTSQPIEQPCAGLHCVAH